MTTNPSTIEQLTFLYEAAQALTASLNTDTVLQKLMQLAHQHFQPDAVSVASVEADRTLVFKAASGKSAQQILGMRLQPGTGIVGWVADNGQSLWVPNAKQDTRHYGEADRQTGFNTQAIYAVPVKMGQRTLAVLELINPNTQMKAEETEKVMSALASLAATAIHNANLFEQVKCAERQFQQLFKANIDPIILLSIEGQILNYNEAAQKLFEFKNRPGSPSHLPQIGLTPEEFEAYKQDLQTQDMVSWRFNVHNAQGERRILEINLTYLKKYKPGEVYQWLAHDVTDQVELDRMRTEWANMVVHDLNGPLNSILNSVELARVAWLERDMTMPIGQILDIARRNAKRLERLISDILDTASIPRGDREPTITDIAIPNLIEEIKDIIEPSAASRKHDLDFIIPAGLPTMPGDADMLQRVLTNLLTNAIKFTPKGGKIVLRVSLDPENFCFDVIDNGPGIATDDLESLFQIFHRGKNAHKTRGSGVGLAFCKVAVEAHNGKIWVESALNKGSRFTVTIPRHRLPQEK
ncbi:MAG: GAF domain-containing protein [Anaerolineae bacterium]|nr:GAF domain-containing protein [Anaerolineae bacterium]